MAPQKQGLNIVSPHIHSQRVQTTLQHLQINGIMNHDKSTAEI